MRSFLGLACMIPLYKYSTVGLGWSDLVLFSNFKTYCRSGIFLGVQFQKIGNFGRSRGKDFIFKKHLQKPSFIHQRTIAEIKFAWYFFSCSKNGQNGCLTVQEKKLYFLVSLRFFLSNKLKKFFFVSGATFKNVKKWFANFRVTVNIF